MFGLVSSMLLGNLSAKSFSDDGPAVVQFGDRNYES